MKDRQTVYPIMITIGRESGRDWAVAFHVKQVHLLARSRMGGIILTGELRHYQCKYTLTSIFLRTTRSQ